MWSAQEAVAALETAGFTHVVWIPDSFFGAWDEPLCRSSLPLIRVTREGEAIGVAAGLLLGEARPLVILQSTGFFEAGDALRNVVYDLQLPLKLLIGLRSYRRRCLRPPDHLARSSACNRCPCGSVPRTGQTTAAPPGGVQRPRPTPGAVQRSRSR